MSTSSAQPVTAILPTRDLSILWRFVWKEFRMLRGLGAAVALLGVATQCGGKLLLPPTSGLPTIMAAIAWSAAVLYAVGAAATMFSVEHEEETYGFLATLPTSWWPLFAGKLLVAAASAFLLAIVLSLIGAMFPARGVMSGADVRIVIGVLGIGVLEALSWGTLFSLLVRRPLVAAFLTLVVGATVVNLIVSMSSTRPMPGASPDAYVETIPMRLAAVAALLAASALIARRWLVTGSRPLGGSQSVANERLRFGIARSKGTVGDQCRGRRSSMLARLLWQTWRESSKLLFLPLLVGVAVLATEVIFGGLISWHSEVVPFCMSAIWLFVPALYGALAFHADQRRGNYRFLAEHAARPRYVWFARHVVWLGFLAIIAIFVFTVVLLIGRVALEISASRFIEYETLWSNYQHSNAQSLVYAIATGADDGWRFVCLAAGGGLLAYSIGQLSSMTIRSEILSVFVALILSFVVAIWMAALFAWRLPGWLFLFPLFAGFMLASWLRAPDWIVGRNTLRSWLKPALAVALPLLLIAVLLPPVRMTQIPITGYDKHGLPLPLEAQAPDLLQEFNGANRPEARKTADIYTNVVERLATTRIKNPLERWETEKNQAFIRGEIATLESTIPANELQAFRAAKKELERLRHQLDVETIGVAIEASKRPSCHFDFDSRSIAVRFNDGNQSYTLTHSCPLYGKLVDLQDSMSLRPLDSKKPFDGYLAALRMSNHLRSGQPSVIYIDQLEREQRILDWIANRSAAKDVTKDQLREVLDKLQAYFRDELNPAGALLADDRLVRDVLTGKDTPLILDNQPNFPPPELHDYLAFLANQLPWEQFRATQALNWITLHVTGEMKQLVQYVHGSQPNTWVQSVGNLRRWIRPRWGSQLPESWRIEVQPATTSYLASLEYKRRVSISELSRVYCDTEVCRRATLIRIALAMYRLDHKKYPAALQDLAPKYLKELPLDPYGQQPFQYLSTGLDLALDPMSSLAKFSRIDPHTPLFWSVGIADLHLRQLLIEPPQDAEALEAGGMPGGPGAANAEGGTLPENPSSKKSELVYVLVSDDPSWYEATALAFPLPQ
jgi:hypothetical protein